jgi:hypothetical protein
MNGHVQRSEYGLEKAADLGWISSALTGLALATVSRGPENLLPVNDVGVVAEEAPIVFWLKVLEPLGRSASRSPSLLQSVKTSSNWQFCGQIEKRVNALVDIQNS